MIASRLSDFDGRTQATTSVKTITGTSVYASLAADHQQIRVQEASGPLGEVATAIHDLFFYDEISAGVLPAIQEKHIVTWNAVDYDVISAKALSELAHRLRVETKRSR